MKKSWKAFVSSCLALTIVIGNLVASGGLFQTAGSAADAPAAADGIYQIASADDLLWAAENPTENYILVEDIDLSGYPDWTPIGTESTPFSGVFNGGGHSIKLRIDQTKTTAGIYMVGLFGSVSGTIANLEVTGTVDAKVHSGYVAPIAANLLGGRLINCENNTAITVEGTGTDKTGTVHVGGLAGAARSGYNTAHIESSANNGRITVTAQNLPKGSGDLGDGTSGTVGGIMGYSCTAASTEITRCVNNGVIVVNGGSCDVGGILGMTSSNNDNSTANITYCANKGDITIYHLNAERAAGIIGYIKNGRINYCYNTGDVLAYTDDGTTISRLSYGTHYGIFGYANINANNPLEVTYCYNASSSPLEAEICLIRNPSYGTFQNFYMQGRTEYETDLGGSEGTAGTAFTSPDDLLAKITATPNGAEAYAANPVQGGYPVLKHEIPAFLPDNNYAGTIDEQPLNSELSDLSFVLQTGKSVDTRDLVITADVYKDSQIIKSFTLSKGDAGTLFKAGGQTYQASEGCTMYYGKLYNAEGSWTQAKITVKKGTETLFTETLNKTVQTVPLPFEDLPEYPGGDISGTTYNAGPGLAVDQNGATDEDSKMVVISQTSAKTFQSYIQTLLAAGFEKISENSIEENIYYTLKKDNQYYYMYYTAYSQTVRIIEDNGTTAELSSLDKEAAGNGQTEFYVYAIDYSSTGQYSKTDYWSVDCGACLVIKFADNSVMIIDGGHQRQSSKTAQESFLNFLYEITGLSREKGEKIHIRSWFFSHAHDDHVYFAKAMLDNYHSSLDLESVMFNFPSYQVLYGGYAVSTFDVKDAIRQYYPDCKVIKLHTGQNFSMQDVYFDVLYTHEDAVSNAGTTTISNFNDTSTVLKVTIDGKTFMLLGDCSGKCRDVLLKMYTAETLHSDCLQVAHHGYDDLPDLYAAIGAPLAFYCNSRANSGVDPGHHNHTKYLGVKNAADNVDVIFADNTYKITVESGKLAYKEIPNYRAAFKTLDVPNLSQDLLTGDPGFREDIEYILANKTPLLDKVIDRSVIGSPGNTDESGYLILDGDLKTKFCTDILPASVVFTMKEQTTINSYILYTGNDTATNSQRNPQNWILCGSNDGDTWTVLDSVSQGNLPAQNSTGTAFKVKNPGAYQYYAIRFFNTEGASVFQISELSLYNGVTSALQSVKDEIMNIPDDLQLEDEAAIQSIREAYDQLSSEDKKLVTNYAELTAAEEKIAELKDAAGTDEPGTDEPGTDKPGTDEPGTDEPSTDKPGTDEPSSDKPGTDEPSSDKPGTDEPGTDEPGTDEPGTDEPSSNLNPITGDHPLMLLLAVVSILAGGLAVVCLKKGPSRQ